MQRCWRILLILGCFLPLSMAYANAATSNDAERARLVTRLQELTADATYLTEEQATAFLDEFAKAYETAKAKENSLANRVLGAAGIGMTGIGGMQVASAISEQNADADAETAMRAYLATFHCNYGDGKNIAGGTKNVEIPGGNELIGLYSEYVNLANNLKIRKAALGLRPGIESEQILDSATSGLYDDVSTGVTSGAYASLARALQNPDGPDAIAWAAQKDKTADKLKTGAIVAGVGAGGSAVGNVLINHTDGKKKTNADKAVKTVKQISSKALSK